MKKKIMSVCLVVFTLLMCLSVFASADTPPYDTYTYSINGDAMKSPHAYTPLSPRSQFTATQMSSITQKVEFGNVLSDICTDPDGWVYIVDSSMNRVTVLNENYRVEYILETFQSTVSDSDTFNEPRGIFVSDEAIYVCDTQNDRIVVFDRASRQCRNVVVAPDNNYFRQTTHADGTVSDPKYTFKPVACAADRFGRLFIISSGCNQGVIVMDEGSNFSGFIGAQKVTYSVFDMFFRRFESDEERAKRINNVSLNLDKLALEHGDHGDFIYAVTTNMDADGEKAQEEAITTKDADHSPVKKLNAKGDEILKRNGFFDCAGEVNVKQTKKSSDLYGVSKISDVAVGPEGTFTLLDKKRSKLFTYDANGQLLFASGDFAEIYQNGALNKDKALAMDYQRVVNNDGSVVYNILVMDYETQTITIYTRTPYGDLLMQALAHENAREYEASAEDWKQIIGENNNFDAAYVGVGRSLYYQGKYDEAMEYLKAAKETTYYAQASAAKSQERMVKYPVLPLLYVAIAIVVVVLFIKLMTYAKRVNYQGNFKTGRRTYWEELMYAFYVSFHPFDGFWDIKHDHRGSLRGGFTILAINALASYYQAIGKSYLANPTEVYSSFWSQVLAIFVPVLLWAIANWCLTTLFDGEGSFKQVLIASCYATAPLPWFMVISTLMTNLSSSVSEGLTTFVMVVGYIWVAFLLFFGTLVVQDYSLGKNVVTTVGTVLCMAVIMFIVILFASLVSNMIGFVSGIVTEINYRS